jgi:hypothetical protein
MLLELSDAHLARAGDTLADAFSFLAANDYRIFARDAGGSLAPVTKPCDGDFWCFPAEKPAPSMAA